MSGEGFHEQSGSHQIGAMNVLREDFQRAVRETDPTPPAGLERFKALGFRNPDLATSVEPEQFRPSFVQKVIDGDRFQKGILESERIPVMAFGIAVVVMYAHATGFLDEIKERIGN